MRQLECLRKAVAALEESQCTYCLIGGHAASLYRSQARVTMDVDFALVADLPELSKDLATKIIQKIGLKPIAGFIPQSPLEPARKGICMITSAAATDESKGIIDILLPELPWIRQAVERAQGNKIDLGFALVPVITPEDLILAKCYALRNTPDRFQDLDDLKELFTSVKKLDVDYLRANLVTLDLQVPKEVRKFATFV